MWGGLYARHGGDNPRPTVGRVKLYHYLRVKTGRGGVCLEAPRQTGKAGLVWAAGRPGRRGERRQEMGSRRQGGGRGWSGALTAHKSPDFGLFAVFRFR